jgi:hypothetical protein
MIQMDSLKGSLLESLKKRVENKEDTFTRKAKSSMSFTTIWLRPRESKDLPGRRVSKVHRVLKGL